MLIMAEELFLLALNDEKGTLHSTGSGELRFGLAGAMLAELTLLDKLALNPKNKLTVQDAFPLEDEILSAALGEVAADRRPKKVITWINQLSNKRYQRLITDRLVARGILAKEEKRFLWVIPYFAYPQQDASAKYWIKQRLRSIVLASLPPAPRDIALLSLLRACRMLNLVFTRDERKAANRQVKKLVNGEIFGKAVAEAIEAIQAAAAAAVIATSAS